MNIILVIFDSLRKDSIGAYGDPFWGKIQTPNFDRFTSQGVTFTHVYPETLPTLPVRRAIYTGHRVYPFHEGDFRLKGDFVGAPGWGPIPEDQRTLAELLSEAGYRTGLVSDVYHQFKPSKNFWRGFQQWQFLRGQEIDPGRSGPRMTDAERDHWIPKRFQNEGTNRFMDGCVTNLRGRIHEEDYFAPRVLSEACKWLQENRDANDIFLTIESFNPHEPWLVPEHYRRLYDDSEGQEFVHSPYGDVSDVEPALMKRIQANYSGSVTQCDRWFGHLMEQLRVLDMLDDTIVILTADHGHAIGDFDYIGKRGYPSRPDVFDIPLIIRFPGAEHAGMRCDAIIQHHDFFSSILSFAGVDVPENVPDSMPLLKDTTVCGTDCGRSHATIGWGSAVTVVDRKWWMNCKVDGTGVLLHDLSSDNPFATNVADAHPEEVKRLFNLAQEDAVGGYPEWLMEVAREEKDAPGCSSLVARE